LSIIALPEKFLKVLSLKKNLLMIRIIIGDVGDEIPHLGDKIILFLQNHKEGSKKHQDRALTGCYSRTDLELK